MHFFRRDDTNNCPPDISNCQPSYITGSDPTEKEDSNIYGPIDYGKPGPHRFIGIAMVGGMIFLALTAYLAFGRRPRRALRKHCRCLGGRKDEEVVEETSMKQVSVGLETSSLASYSSEEKHHFSRTSDNSTPVAQADTNPRSKSRKMRSSRSHSRSRGKHGRSNGRPSDGSAGHYVMDGVDDEPENLRAGWEVDHQKGGVHYEVRTPVDDQTDQRLEVHLQKPSLAYHR